MDLKQSQCQTFPMESQQCITFMITLNNVEWEACLLKIQEAKQLFMDQMVQVGSLLIDTKYDHLIVLYSP